MSHPEHPSPAFLQAIFDLMVPIPAGEITLRNEKTQSAWSVQLQPFWMARVPVTERLFAAFCGGANSRERPVTQISWFDALRFCNLLSEAAGMKPCYTTSGDEVLWDRTADGFRLPTEAEWEHACRAGSTGVRYGKLEDIAWFRENSGGSVREVGLKAPNGWGLHDMIGNVWEWCWDVFDPEVYGPYRVFRGGGWFDEPRGLRASCRRKSHPTFQVDDLGFRLARSMPVESP
ncbi:formylglycine-generating enzyme family protein [Deinococcus cellulosilyticus]|uniref:Sulfatase-modifying factor enzyme-like domain-containing protein n=1 Tax=Deinococcus cellulosilyticus (strain DSM 18568 / NBRC 106333 / KACC 11606 / 5516J-15) TaxID=1223518 RepID=A0A511N8F0_DEIC1|nr:SUMF1/EgtB/PvdO family nonheme iron enzyme [Deinococcus cellulosilyticus]GEM49113.1 hypothetical protein DC3_47480 [Deinococcus cellulosilyticus NBRC 106333 = KACC 11606]